MDYNLNNDSICDYLQLHHQDATLNGSKMTWNIPNIYLSNLRGPMARVSLEEASVSTQQNDNLSVKWLGSVKNGYNTQNDGFILGHVFRMFDGGDVSNYCLNYPGHIYLETEARPSTITLEVCTEDGTGVEITSTSNPTKHGAYFVLKFAYLEPTKVFKTLDQQGYY